MSESSKRSNTNLAIALVIIVLVLLCGCLILIVVLASSGLPWFQRMSRQISVSPSGNVVEREMDISGFDRVEISSAFVVKITQAKGYKVVVRVNENYVDYLEVERQGRTLKIGLQSRRSFSFVGRATLEADVTMPALVGLNMSGASRATLSGFASEKDFEATLSGASSLEGEIKAGDTDLEASGSSRIILRGGGGELKLRLSGASSADLGDFPVAEADIEASGSSRATVNTDGTLNVTASGASTIYYLGTPELGRINTSGASSIKRK